MVDLTNVHPFVMQFIKKSKRLRRDACSHLDGSRVLSMAWKQIWCARLDVDSKFRHWLDEWKIPSRSLIVPDDLRSAQQQIPRWFLVDCKFFTCLRDLELSRQWEVYFRVPAYERGVCSCSFWFHRACRQPLALWASVVCIPGQALHKRAVFGRLICTRRLLVLLDLRLQGCRGAA